METLSKEIPISERALDDMAEEERADLWVFLAIRLRLSQLSE